MIVIILVHFLFFIDLSICSQSRLDLSLHQFSDDGSVQQLQYASQNVARSVPSIGFVTKNSTQLAFISSYRKPNKLEILSRFHNIDILDDSIGLCGSGYCRDIQHLKNKAMRNIQLHRFKFGEIIPLYGLTQTLSTWITNCLYHDEDDGDEDGDKMARPLAISVLLGKYNQWSKKCEIYNLETSGSITNDINIITIGSFTFRKENHLSLLNIYNNETLGIIEKIKHLSGLLMNHLHNDLDDNLYDIEYLIINKDGNNYFNSQNDFNENINKILSINDE